MNDDPLIKVLKQVTNRNTDDRVIVLVAHGLIELIVNTLIDHFCKHGKLITSDTRTYPYATKLLILHEKSILPDAFYETLNRFRKLRNDAAHLPFFKIELNQIRKIAEPIEKYFPPKRKGESYPSDDLGGFCRFLVQSLFSQFQGILLPVFAPSIHKAFENSKGSHLNL
ncbi:MAG: hypothetical protein MHPDNHAH_02467 [Anaerolineales bacterium]|nr:hypothetical protein [Anaerolineales bacterium]